MLFVWQHPGSELYKHMHAFAASPCCGAKVEMVDAKVAIAMTAAAAAAAEAATATTNGGG